jgi:hypothetical protein
MIKVVAFAGSFADAGKYGITAVLGADVADELHDEYGLADAGAAEQAGLAALQVGLQKVDDLDARLQHLVFKRRRVAVDAPVFLGLDPRLLIHRLADDVENAPEDLLPHRHLDGGSGVLAFHAAYQAVGGLHGHGAHRVVPQMLGHFAGDVFVFAARAFNADRVVQGRQLTVLESEVHHRAHNLDDLSVAHFRPFL